MSEPKLNANTNVCAALKSNGSEMKAEREREEKKECRPVKREICLRLNEGETWFQSNSKRDTRHFWSS